MPLTASLFVRSRKPSFWRENLIQYRLASLGENQQTLSLRSGKFQAGYPISWLNCANSITGVLNCAPKKSVHFQRMLILVVGCSRPTLTQARRLSRREDCSNKRLQGSRHFGPKRRVEHWNSLPVIDCK